MASKGAFPFKIENNILIGEENPNDNDCVNVGNLILNAFKSRPDFVGQVDAATEKQSTFQQMRDRSVKCALWLKKQNIKSGDIIAICTHNHLDAYVPLLASLYIGAIANPWNEQSAKFNIKNLLEQVMPKAIFVNDDKAAMIFEVVTELHLSMKIIVFGEIEGFESLESILNFDAIEVDNFSCVKLKSTRDTAIITFSSGTTGFPKGIELPYICFTAAANHLEPIMIPGAVSLWFGSFCWITSVLLTIRAILSYVKAIKSSGFNEEKMCQLIEKYKINSVLLESSMCNYLIKSGFLAKYDTSSLKNITLGGSPIRHEAYESLVKSLPNTSITLVYGLSEICVLSYQRNTGKTASSGYVARNVQLMIADLETGKRLGPNMRGEIWSKSPSLMNCYYKNPQSTKNVIDNDGWFHTGDVGYYDEDGDVFVLERIKELIKYRGHHVSSVEIEVVLQNHPAVLDAAVMPVPHNLDSEHPIAFVRKLPEAEVTEEELKQLVAQNLGDYEQLRAGVVFMKEMPRIHSGKIDRKQLRNLAKTYAK